MSPPEAFRTQAGACKIQGGRTEPRLPGAPILWFLLALLTIALLAGCGLRPPSDTELQSIDSAHASISIAGRGDAPSIERIVALPFDWDKVVGGLDGNARLTLTVKRNAPADEPMALTTRIGNAFHVDLNGAEIQRAGSPHDPLRDTGKDYRLIVLPAALLRDENTVTITLHAEGGRHAGVTQVLAGPIEAVRARFLFEFRYRVYGSLIVATISTMLGLLGLLLWFRQRELLYLVYAAGELLWALQLSDIMFGRSPLPWPWWAAIMHAAYAFAPPLICKFVLMVMGRHDSAVRVALNAFLVLSAPIALAITVGRMPWLWPIWQTVMVALILWVSTLVVYHGIRSPKHERRILALAVIVTAAAAFRDLIIIRLMPGNFGSVPLSRYCWVLFGVTLAWIVVEQLRQATLAVRSHNDTLSQRLAEREAELRLSFQKRIDAERREAVSDERLRLTRDMHDGLGSQLTSALHLARNPGVPREALAEQLTEALDNLKLTVDAMQDIDGDIASLLGALRYRISPRLAAAGIRLDWTVDALPAICGWTVHQSRDLQLILYEALSNILQHSGADWVELSAQWHAAPPDMPGVEEQTGIVEIALTDNGRGFDASELVDPASTTTTAATTGSNAIPPAPQFSDIPPASPYGLPPLSTPQSSAPSAPHATTPQRTSGHGLANMQLRARRLRADFTLESSSIGTELRLVLPVTRRG